MTYPLSGREEPREVPFFGQRHGTSKLWSWAGNLSQVTPEECLFMLGSGKCIVQRKGRQRDQQL